MRILIIVNHRYERHDGLVMFQEDLSNVNKFYMGEFKYIEQDAKRLYRSDSFKS